MSPVRKRRRNRMPLYWIECGWGPKGIICYDLQMPLRMSATVYYDDNRNGWMWRTSAQTSDLVYGSPTDAAHDVEQVVRALLERSLERLNDPIYKRGK